MCLGGIGEALGYVATSRTEMLQGGSGRHTAAASAVGVLAPAGAGAPPTLAPSKVPAARAHAARFLRPLSIVAPSRDRGTLHPPPAASALAAAGMYIEHTLTRACFRALNRRGHDLGPPQDARLSLGWNWRVAPSAAAGAGEIDAGGDEISAGPVTFSRVRADPPPPRQQTCLCCAQPGLVPRARAARLVPQPWTAPRGGSPQGAPG
jgi:hypothetical protein